MTRYEVFVTPAALKEIKSLPGKIRQRVRRAIAALADNPEPSKSKTLDLPEVTLDVRRLRLDQWRILFVVTESEKVVDVLAVRKRPPYDYEDLQHLLSDLPSK